jgi:hypothetical protein
VTTQPVEPQPVEEFRKALQEEYGQYVAIAPIDHDGHARTTPATPSPSRTSKGTGTTRTTLSRSGPHRPRRRQPGPSPNHHENTKDSLCRPCPTQIPNLLTDPGYLLSAPLGTAVPTMTVAGSKFTDLVPWAAAWVPCPGRLGGGVDVLVLDTTVEPIRVAELFDPVKYATTDRAGSMAFSLASWTLTNWQLAMNGGTLAVVSGTGATQLNKYTPAAAR